MSALSQISEKTDVEGATGAGKRGTLLVEGASEAPRLEGVVDLTNTVDTTTHTKQLPAITQEHVTPTVHHILEEKITREIHSHDVFHRIQPIIDVEILPTRHFVPDSDDRLREIPASAVPERQNNWHIAVGPAPLSSHPRSSSRLKPASLKGTETKPPLESAELKPVQTRHRVTHSSDGVERTETTWRHPPVVSPATHKGDDECTHSGKEINTHARQEAKTASEFQGTGHGYRGDPPGLKEQTPVAVQRKEINTRGRREAKTESGFQGVGHGHRGDQPGLKDQAPVAVPTLRPATVPDRTGAATGTRKSTLSRMKEKLRMFTSSNGGTRKLKKKTAT